MTMANVIWMVYCQKSLESKLTLTQNKKNLYLIVFEVSAHVFVPEFALLADGEVLGVAEVRVARVLPEVVRRMLCSLWKYMYICVYMYYICIYIYYGSYLLQKSWQSVL